MNRRINHCVIDVTGLTVNAFQRPVNIPKTSLGFATCRSWIAREMVSQDFTMKRYKAVLFDLFDTLVDLHYERFPLVQIGGELRPSTSEVVFRALREDYESIAFEKFYQAFVATYQELEATKKTDYREIVAQERFRRLLRRVGIESPPSALVEKLIAVHMDRMVSAMECPPARRAVLDALTPHYPLALVSNFDHHPTAYRVLDQHQLTPYFQKIVISGEVGWRKPAGEIFRLALDALGVQPEEALHVGDTLWADVLGANRIGLDAVWFDRHEQSTPEEGARPDYIIHRLDQLVSILGD